MEINKWPRNNYKGPGGGLRKGELKGLTWKDIYFDKKVLSVNKQKTS